jgi:NO-binding membrane sensor protein with MHYT domain
MQPDELSTHGATGALWLFGVLALVVLVLAAQLAFGCGREARRARSVGPAPRLAGTALAAGAVALGSGLWAAMVRAVAGEPLGDAFGYRPLGLLRVWLGAVVLGAVVLAPPVRQPSRLAVLTGGALFGIGVPLLQSALIGAIEPDPGIEWGVPELVLAALVATIGATGGLRMVFRGEGRHGRHRHLLRWVAAGLVGIAVTIAQSLTLAGATLPSQAHALPSADPSQIIASTIAAIVVPAALLAGLMRLWLLRQTRGRSSGVAANAEPAGAKTRSSRL